MLTHHLSEVFGEGIDLLLQKKEGCLDGPQLSFVNNKGERRHLILSVANHLHRLTRGTAE